MGSQSGYTDPYRSFQVMFLQDQACVSVHLYMSLVVTIAKKLLLVQNNLYKSLYGVCVLVPGDYSSLQ